MELNRHTGTFAPVLQSKGKHNRQFRLGNIIAPFLRQSRTCGAIRPTGG